jgi:hypothetical protein
MTEHDRNEPARHNMATLPMHSEKGRGAAIEPYQHFANELTALLSGLQHARITVPGRLPLYVDVIDDTLADGSSRRFIVLRRGEYSLVKDSFDPEIGFLLSEEAGGVATAEPVTYESYESGLARRIYRMPATGAPVLIDPGFREEAKGMVTRLLADLRAQGYFGEKAAREAA